MDSPVIARVPAREPAVPLQNPRTSNRLPALQVLRFLAAFLVVLFHVGAGLEAERMLSFNPFRYGASGVDVFFVLSGFIIAYSTDPDRGIIHFLKRRIARIVPLYWFLTTGVVAIALLAPQLLNSTEVTAEALWKSYLFIPYQRQTGFVQPLLFLGWTLIYEMYFYAVFAVSLLAGRRAWLLACGAIAIVVAAGQVMPGASVAWRFYSDPVTLEFVFGILLYQFYMRGTVLKRGSWALGIALIGIGVALYIVGLEWPRAAGKGIPALLFVAAFLCLRFPHGRILALLVVLGDASYSLYLSHPYIVQVPIKLLSDRLNLLPVSMIAGWFVVIALVASVVLFYCIEKPAQKLILRR